MIPRIGKYAAVAFAGAIVASIAVIATGASGQTGSQNETCSFVVQSGIVQPSLSCNPATTTAPPTKTTPPPTKTTPPPSSTPPPPVQTGFPDASNTGVPAGVALKASGSITASTAGQVIEGLNITGHIDIRAANVVIKDCKISAGSGTYAVQVFSGSVTAEDSTITGSNGFAIGYDNWKGLRLNVSGVGQDGFKGGDNVTLQDSWVHGFTPSGGAHADGIQFEGGGSNSVIRHNSIDPSSGRNFGNSAVFIKNDLGGNSSGPITVDDNLLGGGNYTLYAVPGNGGNQSGIHITNNRFLRDYQYGPVDIGYSIAEWTSNVFDSNSTLISQ